MKAILKATGEVIDVTRNDEGMYIQDNPKQWRYPYELEILGYTQQEVEDIKKATRAQCKVDIAWGTRRFELIKAALQGLCANCGGMLNNISEDAVANRAIEQADAVIKKLKAE